MATSTLLRGKASPYPSPKEETDKIIINKKYTDTTIAGVGASIQ